MANFYLIGHGFETDDGATLLMAFRGLQAESTAQGDVHRAIARDLENLVLVPFSDWANKHRERVTDSKTVLLDGWAHSYEEGVNTASMHWTYIGLELTKDRADNKAQKSLSYESSTGG